MAKIRVLTIEDEVVIAMLLKMMLVDQGFVVLGNAGNGPDGVRMALEEKPDLVLVDIFLAGQMNGIEAAKAITRTHPCKIVYITANSDDNTRQKIRETNPFGFYQKPITKNIIAEIQRKIGDAG